ncbi:MAG: tRNA (guanosine(46)-N7)-methyltransferase TrmB [Verrucomicrobiota bacterium]
MPGEDQYEELEFAPSDYFARALPKDLFPDRAQSPLELDLGCGDGGFLLSMAEAYPERNFLGVERLLGRVRKVARRAKRTGFTNVRLLRLDSSYAAEWLLPRDSFTRIHLLFPDPWPKKKHQKRRIYQPDFLRSLHHLLIPNGEFCFKTDHPEYAEHAEAVTDDIPFFERLPWDEEAFYSQTDFERLWLKEGKTIHSIRLRKT